MKSLVAITLMLIIVSCTTDLRSTRNELLTAKSWIIEQQSNDGEMPKLTETYTFSKDGSYLLHASEVTLNGKWSWTTEGEIFLEVDGLTLKGEDYKYDKKASYYIKIVNLTENGLHTIQRFDGDSWDSGFAKERNYIAQSL